MNRVLIAIEQMKAQVAKRLAQGLVTKAKLTALGKTLNMDLAEYCRFQELKSLAVASGSLSQDEGQTIYSLLGETTETFNKQPVHVKSVLTSVFQELLLARIG